MYSPTDIQYDPFPYRQAGENTVHTASSAYLPLLSGLSIWENQGDIMDTLKRWAIENTVVLERHALERAVKRLELIEALALVRAAYHCSLKDARDIVSLIKREDLK